SSGGVRRHAGKAAAAASTAAAASAALPSGVCAITSPVAGLVTSIHSVALESTQPPLTKFGTLVRVGVARVIDSSRGYCNGFFRASTRGRVARGHTATRSRLAGPQRLFFHRPPAARTPERLIL